MVFLQELVVNQILCEALVNFPDIRDVYKI